MKSLAFVVWLLSLAVLVDAEEATALPSKAERAIQAAKAEITKTHKEESVKVLKELERVKLEETKAGRLESAIAVDKTIKDISSGDFLLHEIIKDRNVDLLGNKQISVVGVYTCAFAEGKTVTFYIKQDSKGELSAHDEQNRTGTVETKKADGSLASIEWQPVGRWVFTLNEDKSYTMRMGNGRTATVKVK